MPGDPLPLDETWNEFVASLWDYRYVQRESPLTKDIREALYEVTMGIPDLAVKVFMLAQYRAIARGKEEITVDTIRSVALDSLRSVNGMLAALRRGDLEYLQAVGDLILIDERPVLVEWQRRLLKGQRTGETEGAEQGRSSGSEEKLQNEGLPEPEALPIEKVEPALIQPVAQAENVGQKETSQEEKGGEKTPPQKVTTSSKRGHTQAESATTKKAPVEKEGLYAALLRARAQKIPGYHAMAEAGFAGKYRRLYPELQQAKRVS
jgi:hypothetical protein